MSNATIRYVAKEALTKAKQSITLEHLCIAARVFKEAIAKGYYRGNFMCISLDRMYEFNDLRYNEFNISKRVIRFLIDDYCTLNTFLSTKACNNGYSECNHFYRHIIYLIEKEVTCTS